MTNPSAKRKAARRSAADAVSRGAGEFVFSAVMPRRGFTLIELVVVLTVITVISGYLLLYNHTSRQQVNLYVEQAKLTQVVSRAKSLSLSLYREASSTSFCGYGVHIDYQAMGYSLFRYPKEGVSPCGSLTAINKTLEQTVTDFSLNRELIFVPLPPGNKNRIDDVLFVPPDPTTLINSGGSLVANGSASVLLRTQDGSAEAGVAVNSTGQISF